MNGLFDTHAHVMDRAFDGETDAVMKRAKDAGLAGMVVLGYDEPTNARALEIAGQWDFAYPAVGFHPHEAKDVTPEMLVTLEAQVALDHVVAVGEIGLDFFRDHSPHDVQRKLLQRQLEIASIHGKPALLHSRGAEDAIADLLVPYAESSPLRANRRPVGIMHCFGGTLEQAQQYVELGFLVSIACTITYPKNEEARRIARELPLESLVIETDSPYLPPQQFRGKRNEPANVRFAAEAIAAARGISVDEVASVTTANAARVLGIEIRQAVRA